MLSLDDDERRSMKDHPEQLTFNIRIDSYKIKNDTMLPLVT